MGVQILNKDVSVIASVNNTVKTNIGSIFGATGWAGGGGNTWVLNFTDAIGNPAGSTDIQTIPQNATLYFEISNVVDDGFWAIYKDGDIPIELSNQPYAATNVTLNLLANDQIYVFFYASFEAIGTTTIKENDSSGRLIDTFNFNVTN